MRITGYPRAWSPATRVAAHRHADRRRGEIEGRLRQVPRQAARRDRDERPARAGRHRLSARSEAADRRGAEETGGADRSGAARASANAPKSYWDEEDEFRRRSTSRREIYEFFAKEGVAALVDAERHRRGRPRPTASTITSGIRRIPASSSRASTTAASCACSIEKQPVKLSLSLARADRRSRRRLQRRRRDSRHRSGAADRRS